MSDFLTLTCPECSTNLKIPRKLTRFSCGTCENEFAVKNEGGIVFLEPVGKELKKIEVNTDKTASELAINRIQKDIDNINLEIRNYKQKLKLIHHYLLHKWFKENPSKQRTGWSKTLWRFLTEVSFIMLSASDRNGNVSEPSWYSDEIDNLKANDIKRISEFLMKEVEVYSAKNGAIYDKEARIIENLKSIAQLMQQLEMKQVELSHHKKIVQKI